MQGDSEALRATLKPLNLQRSGAVLIACMAWFGVEVQLHFSIEDALIKKESIAAHVIAFFSYFTVETNILVALALTIFLLQPQAERFLTGPSVTSALVVYVIVVGVVYEWLLRHLWHPYGMRLFADMLLHDAVPFLYSLYWLLFLPKGSLRWSDPANWLIYPILFFFYTMFRGAACGIYPYPFINRRAGVGQGFGEHGFAGRLFRARYRFDRYRPRARLRRAWAKRAWQRSRTLTNRAFAGSTSDLKEMQWPSRKPRQRRPPETAPSVHQTGRLSWLRSLKG